MPEESPQQQEQKSGSRKGLAVAVGILLVLLAAGGGAVYFMAHGGSPTAESKQNSASAAKEELRSWNLGSLVVNLAPPDDQTYLKVEVALGYRATQDALISAELETRRDQLLDLVNMTLSSKKYGEVNNVHGKTQLKEELIRQVNEILSAGKIDEIYFRSFTFQET